MGYLSKARTCMDNATCTMYNVCELMMHGCMFMYVHDVHKLTGLVPDRSCVFSAEES